ncbi:MAG: PPOX class F420-dependent oxidoreductase, partial [Vicinamibacterales bacterium]
MSSRPADPFAPLREHRYMALTTFRRNGEPVSTAIWFALNDGKLYCVTGRDNGKTRRLRRNPRVQVAPSDFRGNPRGPAIEGTARVLPAVDDQRIYAILVRKYGMQLRLARLNFR